MSALRQWGLASRAALACVVMTTGTAAAAAWQAWRVDPLPPYLPLDGEAPYVAPERNGETTPMSTLLSAVARDPFRSDRTGSPNRYRLPGEAAPVRPAVAVRPPFTGVTLVGTTIRGDTRVAVLKMPRRAARLVHIGDVFEGLELVSVERRVATLVGLDTTVVLELPGPPGGSTPRPDADSTEASRAAAASPRANGANR